MAFGLCLQGSFYPPDKVVQISTEQALLRECSNSKNKTKHLKTQQKTFLVPFLLIFSGHVSLSLLAIKPCALRAHTAHSGRENSKSLTKHRGPTIYYPEERCAARRLVVTSCIKAHCVPSFLQRFIHHETTKHTTVGHTKTLLDEPPHTSQEMLSSLFSTVPGHTKCHFACALSI